MSATNYAALAEADMRRYDWEPEFSPWRHGGWYVDNIRYPSGAVGCVSRTYPDGRWRIVCDERTGDRTYPSRVGAAQAERYLSLAEAGQTKRPDPSPL
jgi:hypothetical protein